jgi:hypothetical protein
MPVVLKKPGERRRARGGVNPNPHEPATHDLQVLDEPKGPINKTAAFPNFAYHGGPVVDVPVVYASFWGSRWQSDPNHQQRANNLKQFLIDLTSSQYMNVLHQYGVGSGCFLQASFLDNVPDNLNDAQIRRFIQDLIDGGILPPGGSETTQVIVYLADNIGVNDPGEDIVMCEPTNDDAFGYHSFFQTTQGGTRPYAVIPGLSDACLRESCPSDRLCSLHLIETQEQRQTQVTSHEFAEMVTDPQLNAWFDSDNGLENGDICNGESATITIGANTWTVQRQYSRADDIASNGANYCVVTAPNPMAPLSHGPARLARPLARVQQMQAVARIFPLPDVHVDATNKTPTHQDRDLQEFARRLLYPLQHSRLIGDLPGLLRRFADTIEKMPE